MKKFVALLLSVLPVAACFAGCHKAEAPTAKETLPVPEIAYEVPEWYRDAKFGIFIHYGLYSVPAYGDEWYGHWMYIPDSATYGDDDIYTHHKEVYGGAKAFGYKEFIPDFIKGISAWNNNNGAEAWAALFDEAGAKYVMPVGIHHDSYALYDSDIQTTYNSVAGAGVDYIGTLQKAVKARGIKFGISNHFAENDWFFDEGNGKDTDLADPAFAELYGTGGEKTDAHVKKWYDISMEIIEKYRPALISYDFDLQNDAFNTYENANRYLMLKNYYDLAESWDGCEGVVCNYKHSAFTQEMAVLDKEREALGSIQPIAWQTDTSVGAKSWGYITNEEYRSGEEFITALIDIVSKNGNLLLNIGPKADGSIPAETQQILKTIGAWLHTYGDAIYATRPWTVYGEGATENSGDSYRYTGEDIRFTKSKDNRHLYITALGKTDTMRVTTLNKQRWDGNQIAAISLINGSKRIPLHWKQNDEALTITLPDGINGACAVDVTFKDGGGIPSLLQAADEVIQAGDDAAYRLNFANDTTVLVAETANGQAGTLNIYLDDSAEALATVNVKENDTVITAPLPVTAGEHRLRFESGDGVAVAKFKCAQTVSADNQIEAESFDLSRGNVRAESCPDGGENLGYVSEGDCVCFGAVDFGDGKTKLAVRLAGSGQSANIRLDAPDGEVLCKIGGKDTGGWETYETFSYKIKKTKGVHSVYITYDNDWSDMNINWLQFS